MAILPNRFIPEIAADLHSLMPEFLSALLDLVVAPYLAWKGGMESSRIGVSSDEKKTLRFWGCAAMMVTVLVLIIVGLVLMFSALLDA
jgi:hypothetical protein